MLSTSTNSSKPTSEASTDFEAAASKRHLRGSSLLLAGRFISLGLSLLANILLVRLLAKSDYGALSYALALGSAGATLAALGLDKTIARFVPIYHEHRDYGRMFGTVVLAFASVFIVGFGMAITVWTLHSFIAGSMVRDPLASSLLMILVLLSPLEALDYLLAKLLAAFSRPRAIFFRKHLVAPGLKLCVVLLFVPLNFGLHALAVAYLAASLLGTLLYVWMLIGVCREQNLWPQSWSLLRFPVRELFGFSLPLLSSDLVYVLRSSMAIFLLGYLHSTASVAEFRAVLPIARLNHVVFESFILLFLPTASRLFARGDFGAVSSMYWRTASWVAVLTFPCFAVTFVLAKPLTVLLFGSRYAESAAILSILALGHYANAAIGFNGVILRVFGKVTWIICVDVVTMLLAVVLAGLLIPSYGALGAAWAVSLTHIANNILAQFALSRLAHMEALPMRYLRTYLAIVPTTLALLLLQWTLQPPLYAGLALAAIGSAVVVWINRDVFDAAEVFPELNRIPLWRRLCSAPTA